MIIINIITKYSIVAVIVVVAVFVIDSCAMMIYFDDSIQFDQVEKYIDNTHESDLSSCQKTLGFLIDKHNDDSML